MARRSATFAGLAVALALGMACGANALTLTRVAGISFGTIEFTGDPVSGNVTMGTNGTVTYGTSLSGSGVGTVAQVELADAAGTVIDIRCTDTSTLAVDAGHTIAATHAIVIGPANLGAYPAAMGCQGPGTTVTSYTLSGTPADDTIYLTALLNTNGLNLINGTYTTTNAGGAPAGITAIVQ